MYVGLVTPQRASHAIDLATPSIMAAMESGATTRKHLHCLVVVRNQGVYNGYITMATKSFGTVEEWAHPYDQIAIGKAEITVRTGLSTREVQQLYPHMLMRGDVKYYGSVIAGDIIVACSGVQPWYDETFAKMVLNFILADIESDVNESRAKREVDIYDDI